MASSQEFVEHVLDLLAPLGAVQARRLFGGHGLYARGVMFGLLDDDELFLKTDAETRPRFVEAGCRMWSYRTMRETSYFRPPDEAHEDPIAMLPWARLALDAALRARSAAITRGARKAAAAHGAPSAAPRTRRGDGTPAGVSARRAGQPTPPQGRRPRRTPGRRRGTPGAR